MKPIKLLAPFALLTLAAACSGDGYDGLREKADIEAQRAAENQMKYETEALRKRARAMEADLARRQRFYQGLAGEYEGQFQVEGRRSFLRLTLTPTVFPVEQERDRLPEEIAQDLNDLAFDVHVVQWSEQFPDSGFGCRAEDVRANIEQGQVHVVVQGDDCTFTYSVSLAAQIEELEGLSLKDRVLAFFESKGEELAAELLEGKGDEPAEIVGIIRPTLRPTQFFFEAKRL